MDTAKQLTIKKFKEEKKNGSKQSGLRGTYIRS